MSNENQALKHTETDINGKLSSSQVEAYLKTHPEFFHNHLALLENLSIPHPSGEAVSLISKQLELFRSKHHELENQLTTLIDIARENDTSFSRMHELTLALMEAKSIEQVSKNLEKVFADCFLTDFVSLRIINKNKDLIDPFFVDPTDENLQNFSEELTSNKSKCGKPTLAQAKFLFAEQALDVKSCAIIPMVFTKLEGLVAIGSKDESRFHYSMGDLFLTQMGEVIGTRLISILE
jgi:hypothetical protein